MSAMSTSHSSVFVPYEKPVSTWKTLTNGLNAAECEYVKFYLGQSLIEKYAEIEGEVDSLLDIWRDYRNETIANCTNPSAPTLAEPPVLRQRLTTEIEFFVKHIHEQCANNDQIFHRRLSQGHNWNAINYAMVTGTGDDERRIRERPVSARDRQGRETPTLIIPQPASNADERQVTHLLSPRNTVNIDAATVRHKLQDFTLDDITKHLRAAISDDMKMLEQHVTYLHQKLEEEADYRAKTRGLLREPTLGGKKSNQQQLKDERNRLEKEVFQTANSNETPPISSSFQRQTSEQERHRRSSASSTGSSVQSPRSSLDAIATPPARAMGPLRAFAADPVATTKPRLGIDRKGPSTSNTPVLVRLGSINQQDLLKKYSSLNTATPTNTTTTTKPGKSTDSSTARINSADKFRRMVLDCRELSS